LNQNIGIQVSIHVEVFMTDETIEKTFQVSTPARLNISNIRGSVTIQPGEAGVIEVKAVKHGNFDSDRFRIEMSQDADGTVRVETHSDEAFFGFLSHPPKVDYSVRLPQTSQLDASCVSSSLSVNGLEGKFRLRTVSGDMQLEKLTGPFKLNAVSGDITGSNLSGMLDLSTVSGRVHLTNSGIPSANATTVSGDIILQTPISQGPYQFSSVSGAVRLLVPIDTRCNVELHSVSGSIRSSLPATSTKMGHGLKVTEIQGGGIQVHLKSVSGSVSIETEGVPANSVPVTAPASSEQTAPPPPAAPMPPTEPAQPATPEPLSTAEILQRIERGEMTVEEALKLMKEQS
jgi:hypothetical protein